MSTKDLQAKVKELKELQRMSEELEQEITSIQDTIKAEMTALNTDELTTGEYKIRWTATVAQRFNSTKFKKEHKELYNQYLNISESRRFSIV